MQCNARPTLPLGRAFRITLRWLRSIWHRRRQPESFTIFGGELTLTPSLTVEEPPDE